MRTYARLSVEDFGMELLRSNDLDPIYVALDGAGFEDGQLRRWLLAYWCFYHAGAASYLSEQKGDKFWIGMLAAAENTTESPAGGRWPRAPERRHFRGQSCVKAVEQLMERYGAWPEGFVKYAAFGAKIENRLTQDIPFALVSKRVREHRLFGPWIAFKVGDMLERLKIAPVSFDQAAVFMFKDPREAAIRVWREKTKQLPEAQPRDEQAVIDQVVGHLTEHFKGHLAPPLLDRPIGLQEVETILCKWKSHMNGHYPLWNDIDDIHVGLLPWVEVSPAAAVFLKSMPPRREEP